MNRAGSLVWGAAFLLLASGSFAQLPPAGTPPVESRTVPSDRESSLTVQQIVARQEQNYRLMKTLQGNVVWTDTAYGPGERALNNRQTWIFFARQDNKSVTVALPQDAAADFRRGKERIDWSKAISGCLILGDRVFSVSTTGTSTPEMIETPYNPAIHDNNPFVSYHPRQLGDERIPLRDLARAIPDMVTKPRVTDITIQGRPYQRIDFTNAAMAGEDLYYLVDPARAWLPIEIGRISGGHRLMLTQIVIGKTRDGLWIPARKTHTDYAPDGSIKAQSKWYYDYLSCNEKLAPRIFTPMYFGLSPETRVRVARDPAGVSSGQRSAASSTPVPVPRQTPNTLMRQAPRPVSVPLP